ncbi:hypothetical protein P7266_0731 [Lactococcus cremoris]|nr:hypothetical protein P7266_0731 [Lactococcus cremoris]
MTDLLTALSVNLSSLNVGFFTFFKKEEFKTVKKCGHKRRLFLILPTFIA